MSVGMPADKTADRWEILESRYPVKDRWLTVRSDRVRLPDGTIVEPFHVLEAPANMNVIALTAANEVVLVEQWRHPVDKMTVEFPAGAADPGEDPLTAAKRELLEETGYTSDRWHLLGTCDAHPSRQDNQLFSYLALDARKVAEPQQSASERVRIALEPWPKFRAQLASGERTMGAMHYAAVTWLTLSGRFPA